MERALELLESCTICPRMCNVNRLEGETGFCGIGRQAKVASYNSHFGEELPLVGRCGSGTIFMSSCNLFCTFCQNFDISHHAEGIAIEPEQMAEIMIQLAERGCHNINFVTPTHVVPQILEALPLAIQRGLNIPLVYNSGGYDSAETIRLLEGIFDIYMPDFKFWDEKWADRFCKAPDYRSVVIEAIKEMYRQVGDLATDDDGIAYKGLLVRHLVMPNNVSGFQEIMPFLAKEISTNTYVNIMDQYRPCGKADQDEIINRLPTSQEYSEALDAAEKAGLTRLDSKTRPRLVFQF
ncbi:MAG: radical SAM protein [Desulfatiglans sp.]|nr:radical SAM protein [Desulfatiglans sp.]